MGYFGSVFEEISEGSGRLRAVLHTTALLFLLVSSAISTAWTAPRKNASDGCAVEGRVEILNAKVRLRGGEPDASGVVLWLTPSKGAPKLEKSPMPRGRIEQRDKRFVPHVLAVQVGTEVDFPNSDLFFHNVFSVFDGKTFDLGLYAKGESRPVRFNRPGISYIFCNIHPQMSAVIVALETPYFAISGPDGNYSIKNVPPGSYWFHLWHERVDPKQLAALSRVVIVDSAAFDLGAVHLDEAGYIPRTHKDKHGQEYSMDRDIPAYRRP